MSQNPGLIVLMLDGISADTLANHRSSMPYIAGLAEGGFRIERLHSEVPGTSLPGRTSILTGATAEVNGVFGNMVWDGTSFRYAHPDDVRVKTLPRLALEAGRDVAAIGFGMIRPDDVNVFHRPWWAGTFIQRARDAEPIPSNTGWLRVANHVDQSQRLERALSGAGLSSLDATLAGIENRELLAAVGDRWVIDAVGALLAGDQAPEIVFAEVLIPDTVQHYHGHHTPLGLWSVAYADGLVGLLLEHLRRAGLADRYNLAVLSDHGHSPIERALQPEVIIPGARFASEGSTLHVAPLDTADAERVIQALAEHGVELASSEHVPEDLRAQVLTFFAPERTSFEYDANLPQSEAIRPPRAISSHGLRPGSPGDDRFAVFSGPNVERGSVATAQANQVAPTLALLAGLDRAEFEAESVLPSALVSG